MAYVAVVDGSYTSNGVNDGMGGYYFDISVPATAQVGDAIIIWGFYLTSGASTPSDNLFRTHVGLTTFNWYEYTSLEGTVVEEGSVTGVVDDDNIPIGGTVRLYTDTASVVSALGFWTCLILRPETGYNVSSFEYAGAFDPNNGDVQSQGSYSGLVGTASIDVPDVSITMAPRHNLVRLFTGYAQNMWLGVTPSFSQNSQDTYNEAITGASMYVLLNGGFYGDVNGKNWGFSGFRNTGEDITETLSRGSFTVTGSRLNNPAFYVDIFEEGVDVVLTPAYVEPVPADVVKPTYRSRKVYVKELPYTINDRGPLL